MAAKSDHAEILRMLLKGEKPEVIAQVMNVSTRTVARVNAAAGLTTVMEWRAGRRHVTRKLPPDSP